MFGLSSDQAADSSKRLVLGYDGGCCACSGMAERIKEQIGDKLEVMSLRDPQAQEWRKTTLGEDAPWAPTLFEVNGSEVRAWTGWRMGVQLSHFLGPVATWRVMQVLGEVRATSGVVEESPVAKIAGSLTRGQFLKGVGGAALAMSVLSTVGKFARPAMAFTSTGYMELTGYTLAYAASRKAAKQDVINLMGKTWSDSISRATCYQDPENDGNIVIGCDCSISTVNGQTTYGDYCARVKGGKHRLSNGNRVTSIAYAVSNSRILVFMQYRKLQKKYDSRVKVRTEAYLYKDTGATLQLIGHSLNGRKSTVRR